jgi:arylsulfate sulfotransferase
VYNLGHSRSRKEIAKRLLSFRSRGKWGCAQLRNSRAILFLSTGVLLIFVSLGCGSGNSTAPPTAIAATSHPLVAQYSIANFHVGLGAWVEFGTDTTYGRQTSVMTNSVTTPGGQILNILVAGMKPQTTYHMRAHVDWAGGSWVDQDHTFTTGALPSSPQAPPAISVVATPVPGVTHAPGVELLDLLTGNYLSAVVADLQGNVIWYCPGAAFPIKPMQNGHFIINRGTDLQEVDLTCNTTRDVSLAQVNQSLQANGYSFTVPPPLGLTGGDPFHHDVLVLPNGHWIGLCQITKSFTDLSGYPGTTVVVGDALVDIDLNGNVVWAWSAFDHLDVNRHPFPPGLPDWTHSNALVYTPDGNLLLSMRAQNWILKIDYANGTGSGNILWKLGEDGDFTLLGGDPSQWFYGQHYPNLMSTNGSQMTLAVYDDGNFRVNSDGVACLSSPSAPACYSRAAIFQVDESTYLASLLWQDLPGFYSFWGGSIGVLGNGNVEFDSTSPSGGPSSQIMEVTQTDSPQIVWQMSTTGQNAYRGYRIPSLYPGVMWNQ